MRVICALGRNGENKHVIYKVKIETHHDDMIIQVKALSL